MGDYQINCVIQERGVITQVGIGSGRYTVKSIIDSMSSGNTFYTYKNGNRVEGLIRLAGNSNHTCD